MRFQHCLHALTKHQPKLGRTMNASLMKGLATRDGFTQVQGS